MQNSKGKSQLEKLSEVNDSNYQHIGIIDFSNNIQDYPNISEGTITITFKGLNNKINLQIQNIQGSAVYYYNFYANSDNFSKTIDLSEFPKGTYYIQIVNDGKTFIQKFVKE